MRFQLFVFLLFVAASYSFSQVTGNAPSTESVGNHMKDRMGNAHLYPQRILSPNHSTRSSIANAQLSTANPITLEVRCLKNVEADSYTAVFHITQKGKTAESTDKFMNGRLAGFTDQLAELGIPSSAIVIDMLTMIPVYEYEVEKKVFNKRFNEVPKGFEMKKNVHVQFKKVNVLDDIITAAAKHEIYDIVKVDYYTKNMEEHFEEMKRRALETIKAKESFYEDFDIQLRENTEIILAEAKATSFPVENYYQYQAYSSSSLDKGKRGEVVNAEKNITYYYNAIPNKDFDVIINPEVIEPVLQLTYNLKVQYRKLPEPVQPKPEVKTEIKEIKKFYLVTPDGKIQLMPVE
ncbi:MAG: SIMPL domain-containing protein [Bacteroidota bacterium]